MIADRYVDSSLAYQGVARGLGVEQVLDVNLAATGSLLPDRTIVLDLPREVAAGRLDGGAADRIEAEADPFHASVADGFAAVARRFPERVVVVDGSGEPTTWPPESRRRWACDRFRRTPRAALRRPHARRRARPARPRLPPLGPCRKRQGAATPTGSRRPSSRRELGRVERRTHPDLFVLEPEGQGILVEGARRLRRDLYLRPYEAARRVYLILDAHLLRDESANALLKSIEEPPEYGVFVLVSDHAGRMLPTILSRVQTVPFRRFPAAALEAAVSDPVAARAALGSLTRAEELAHDPAAAGRRRAYLEIARASASDSGFDPAAAAAAVLASTGERAKAESAKVGKEATERLASVDDPKERRTLEPALRRPGQAGRPAGGVGRAAARRRHRRIVVPRPHGGRSGSW